MNDNSVPSGTFDQRICVETNGSRRFLLFLFAIFALSGVAGLIYEAVWGRYLRFLLGHSAYAQTFVIAVFMGGMAIGAWISSQYSRRWKSLLRAYAVIEILIGIYAILFHQLFVMSTEWAFASMIPTLSDADSVQTFKQFLALALILPPSVLLGMTFPLMSGGVIRLYPKQAGSALAMLYFTNSIGAALGVLLTGFVFIAIAGLPGTILMAGIVNLLIGLIMFVATKDRLEPELDARVLSTNMASPNVSAKLLLFAALFTGLASFVYEIAWIRMLSMILGSSSHAFELMLGTFIAGLAFGGLWIKRRIDQLDDVLSYLGKIQCVMGFLALATIIVYNYCFDIMSAFMSGLARNAEGYVLFNVGSNLLAVAVMFPAAFCAGMTLPLITNYLLKTGHGERSIGRVYAFNTCGAIFGVFLTTHFFLPLLGLKGSVVLGAGLDLMLGLLLLFVASGKQLTSTVKVFSTLVLVCLTASTFFQFDRLKMASGVFRTGSLDNKKEIESLYHHDGKTASVSVVQHGDIRIITTNGKPDASINMRGNGEISGDESTQTLLAALPLAAHAEAKSAAVIGFGSGMTSAALLSSDNLERLDTIEIEQGMVEGAKLFAPYNTAVYEDPRSNIVFADARTYFSAENAAYDLIISEPSNPWVSGVASMFSTEFYERLQAHIKPGGVFAQWLHLYELGPELIATVMNAFSQTFPDYTIFETSGGDWVIMARNGGRIGALSGTVFEWQGMRDALAPLKITSLPLLENHRIGNSTALSALFASYNVPANSEYFPYLDLRATRSRFLRDSAIALSDLSRLAVPMVDMLGGEKPIRHHPGKDNVEKLENTDGLTEQLLRTAISDQLLGDIVDGEDDRPDWLPEKLAAAAILLDNELQTCGGGTSDQDELVFAIGTVGVAITPYLDSAALDEYWSSLQTSSCFNEQSEQVKAWVAFFDAAGARDLNTLYQVSSQLTALGAEDNPRYSLIVMTQMAGLLFSGQPESAIALWEQVAERWDGVAPLSLRLVLSHAYQTGAYNRAVVAESLTDD